MKMSKKIVVASGAFSALLAGVTVLASNAFAETCSDGWNSPSSGRGTCSWHGGISGGSGLNSNRYGNSYNDPYGMNNGYGNSRGYGNSYNDPYGMNNGYGGSRLGGSTLGGSRLGGSTLGGSTLGGSTLGGLW